MSTGKASREKREDSPSMSGETGEDIGAVTSDTSDNANMFCRVRKRDKIFTDMVGRNHLRIFNKRPVC